MKRYFIGLLLGFSLAALAFITNPDLPNRILEPVYKSLRKGAGIRHPTPHSLAITRAEGLNMAMASFIQTDGASDAEKKWRLAGSDEARYKLLRPFLSFAPLKFGDFSPENYVLKLPDRLGQKTFLFEGTEISY